MSGAGSAALKRFRQGERLTRGEAIEAKCAECTNDYDDGRVDCNVQGCPLYPFMPYAPEMACAGRPRTKELISEEGPGKDKASKIHGNKMPPKIYSRGRKERRTGLAEMAIRGNPGSRKVRMEVTA